MHSQHVALVLNTFKCMILMNVILPALSACYSSRYAQLQLTVCTASKSVTLLNGIALHAISSRNGDTAFVRGSYVPAGHRMQLLDYHTDVLHHVGNGQWQHHTSEQFKRQLSLQNSAGDLFS